TLADGTVQPISRESVVNRDDSERDLARRAADFAKGASDTIGADKWNALPGNVQAALTSTAYNYGSLSKVPAIVRAAQAGDIEGIAQGLE
ncbi:hypothetical protein KC217_21085, partial [Mycobacterium tuberculosis]|nr:hypothetical protein [Mycobacterium tuberculosis]